MKVIELNRQPVELYKILKFEGLVDNGGEAKAVIADGRVLVNGVVEIQKRKKIVSGDVIEFGSLKARVHYVAPTEVPSGERSSGKAAPAKAAPKKVTARKIASKKKVPRSTLAPRRPIPKP